jgi:hypothetical protein
VSNLNPADYGLPVLKEDEGNCELIEKYDGCTNRTIIYYRGTSTNNCLMPLIQMYYRDYLLLRENKKLKELMEACK